MIYLGLPDAEKRAVIAAYQAAHGLRHTVVISADEFPLPLADTDQVRYRDVIMYVTYYRLLQAINPQTLIVINECLRTQNRYDLAYNCIRNYLNQTRHQLVFQRLPQIDTAEDFMVLFDFDTQSRWKRRAFDPDLVAQEAQVRVYPHPQVFVAEPVPTAPATRARYAKERERLFRELGNRDPHLLPRNLYLIGGSDKEAYRRRAAAPLFGSAERQYVARGKRRAAGVVSYAEVAAGGQYAILELPHRFIDFCDFGGLTGQNTHVVLTADLPVDAWYLRRYQEWSARLNATYASLSS